MKSNATLLYAEDEDIIRESFTEIFSKYFTNVITSNNGTDALKLYQENEIDIAILDITMPGIDGLTLATKIREHNKKIEIIVLTAHSEKDKLLKAINLHLLSYLIKPVKKDELNDTLNRAISRLSKNNTINLSNDYSFNTKAVVLYYKDAPIRLSKNEKKLVSFLCNDMNSHYSACDISEAIFDYSLKGETICNNVIQLISRFKKKMVELHNTEDFFIDNIYGLGYKIKK